MAAVAVVLTGAAALITGCTGSGHDDAHEPGSVAAVAEKLASGQAQDRARTTADLAAAADEAHGHMAHVLQELAAAVPLQETTASSPATASDVEGWKRDLDSATTALETVGEGTSEQTIAREAFIGAARLLDSASAGYELVLAAPAVEQEPLAATVAERRDAAVRLWQAGAAQLDTLTIDSGEGHVHLFLAPNGDPDAVPLEFREAESGE